MAARSGCALNFATQNGASAMTTAFWEPASTRSRVDAAVFHPPHEKPTIAMATAPPTAPQRAGFTSAGIFTLSAFQFKKNGSFSFWLNRLAKPTSTESTPMRRKSSNIRLETDKYFLSNAFNSHFTPDDNVGFLVFCSLGSLDGG